MEQQLRARIEQLQKDNAKSSHDIANKNDRWFLKSNRRLSQSDDHGRLGGHRGGRHGDRHGGGHGKQDEDSEMTMAALLSEKTFWEDQCKQQKEDFEVCTFLQYFCTRVLYDFEFKFERKRVFIAWFLSP